MDGMIYRLLYIIVFICSINSSLAQNAFPCLDIGPMPPIYSFVCVDDTMKCTIHFNNQQTVYLCNRNSDKKLYSLQLSDTVAISLYLRRLWDPFRPLWNTHATTDEIKFSPVRTCKCHVNNNVISFRLKSYAYSGVRVIWKIKEDPLYSFLVRNIIM